VKKIRLDLSELKVESFVASGGAAGAVGTVFGMDDTNCGATCNPALDTCDGGECGWSNTCPFTNFGLSCTEYTGGPTDFCTEVDCTFTCNPPETCNPQCVHTEGPVRG